MNFWIEGKPEDLRRVLEKVDIVFINDSEARMLSGREDLDEAASRVMGMGPGIVIIKKGAHGADLFTKDMKYVTPAFPLDDVLDPTGAGDTFAGGFMGYIASAHSLDGETLENAMAYAGVSASFTCEKFSVERLRDLELEEITGRYEVLRGIIRDNAEYGRFPFKGPSGPDA
jgi:sugar/nucleoside kinase (ribokinase family)